MYKHVQEWNCWVYRMCLYLALVGTDKKHIINLYHNPQCTLSYQHLVMLGYSVIVAHLLGV